MAWRGADEDAAMYLASGDLDFAFTPRSVAVPGDRTDYGPSLTVRATRIYLAWEVTTTRRVAFASTSDGVGWSPATLVDESVRTWNTPTICGRCGMALVWAGSAGDLLESPDAVVP